METTTNRLTVVGSKAQVRKFRDSGWEVALQARYFELMENSPGRFGCQFETQTTDLHTLQGLSSRWPRLTLLLDYESESRRTKGLAKAAAGKLERYAVTY